MNLEQSGHEKIAARAQIKFGHDEQNAASEAAEMICGSHDLCAMRGQSAVQLVWGGVTSHTHEGPRLG